jgi:tetratricopeptide (TPR) repeat protein
MIKEDLMFRLSPAAFRIAGLVSLFFLAQQVSAADLAIVSDPPNALVLVNQTGQSCRTPCKLHFENWYFDQTGGNWVDSKRLMTLLTATVSLDGYSTKEIQLTDGPHVWVGEDLHIFRIPYFYVKADSLHVVLETANYLAAGIEQFNQHNYGAALQSFDKEIRKNPSNAEAYYYSYQTHSRIGDELEAVDMLRKAVALNPNQIEWQIVLADLYTKTGMAGDAAKLLEGAAALRESELAGVIYNLGTTYVALQRRDDAVKCVALLQTLDPASAARLRAVIDTTP